ncbi:MAG: hypothetical protein GF350_04240 [Chitinivibrionales bacterium]|nr:hypothetical protein [Chitinivibrionales bacterium]
MKLNTRDDGSWLRFYFEDTEPWSGDSFFEQLDRMFATVKGSFQKSHSRIVFDFSRSDRIDSSIIALLVQTIRLAGDRRVAVIMPDTESKNLLLVMGIDKLADIYDSETAWKESSQ